MPRRGGMEGDRDGDGDDEDDADADADGDVGWDAAPLDSRGRVGMEGDDDETAINGTSGRKVS